MLLQNHRQKRFIISCKRNKKSIQKSEKKKIYKQKKQIKNLNSQLISSNLRYIPELLQDNTNIDIMKEREVIQIQDFDSAKID